MAQLRMPQLADYLNIAKMIENHQEVLVKTAIDMTIEHNLAGADQAAETGSVLMPAGNQEAQLLCISAAYFDSACRTTDPNIKLWQYALALTAAMKSRTASCVEVCLKGIEKDFPKLSPAVKEFFGIK